MEPKLISRAVGALVLAFLVALVLASSMLSAMAQRENGVTAGSLPYNSDRHHWEHDGKKCADLDANEQSLAFRTRYRWAEFCGERGPRGSHACFRCLEVRAATGGNNNSVTVRIVDICDPRLGAALWIDNTAFDEIKIDQGTDDGDDGQGTDDDQGTDDELLQVNYEFVNCDD